MTAEPAPAAAVDLASYLTRIGYGGSLEPTAAVLRALHLAHATHIPFENLDILLGRPIRLDLGSLQAKLVAACRGGYCFEQNTLFAAMLREFGFDVTLLAARVRLGATRVLPRTHMALRIRVGDTSWLADVGFGASGLFLAIAFGDESAVRQFSWDYRLVEESGQWAVQSLRDGAWVDLYAFTLEPQLEVDFEVANHYVSTHPQSRFVQTLTAQRLAADARHTLVNREYSVDRGVETSRFIVSDDGQLLELLSEVFGLHFSRETRFSVLGGEV